ncbi:hypothetical protein QUF70_20570, partial [Desulfobacterales bacterium HSG17]|nr:hypothetical protein [Desulfobacterales bacterium HSG17]
MRKNHTIIAVSIFILLATQMNTSALTGNDKEFYSCPENERPLSPKSFIKLGIYKRPNKEQKGWQPRAGVKIETEEKVVGETDRNGWLKIPVYCKEPLEVIKIRIEGKIRKVPTFGPKKNIKG